MKSILRPLVRRLPAPGQRMARTIYSSIIMRMKTLRDASLKRRLFGAYSALVPPLYVMDDGPQDYEIFKRAGYETYALLTGIAGLKSADRILDIGSGLGRQILQLLPWMADGSYEGLEPIRRQVTWCQSKITPRYPNFKFQQINVWSKLYNPEGLTKPADYVFPFPAGEFDFVMLGSVFTHMFSSDIRHYISEIARVMKPGGRGMITYFLLNDESERLMASGQSNLNLVYPAEEGAKMDNRHRLETAIGHPEENILEMFRDFGLEARIGAYGSWCGRPSKYYQDIVLISQRQ